MPVDPNAHIALEALWKYRADSTPLDPDQLSHLYACNDCLSVLGICQISKSVEEVEKLRRGKPRTGKEN
jgi:hypothetical protein